MTPSNRGSPGVTAVIAAHDEAAQIEACIASLEWVSEVIVVENDSIDDTVDRARGAGATVISPKFTTIGMARNNAIERAKTQWVLVVDADGRSLPFDPAQASTGRIELRWSGRTARCGASGWR